MSPSIKDVPVEGRMLSGVAAPTRAGTSRRKETVT